MRDTEGESDVPQALAGFHACQGLEALVPRQLGRASEPHAAFPSAPPSLADERAKVIVPIDGVRSAMTAPAQGDEVGLLVAAAEGTGHEVMVLEVIGVVVPAGRTKRQSHP